MQAPDPHGDIHAQPGGHPGGSPDLQPPLGGDHHYARAAAMRPREIGPQNGELAREMWTVPARIIRLMTCREERLPSSRLPVQGEKANR